MTTAIWEVEIIKKGMSAEIFDAKTRVLIRNIILIIRKQHLNSINHCMMINQHFVISQQCKLTGFILN